MNPLSNESQTESQARERQEDVLNDAPYGSLTIDLSDEEFNTLIGDRIENSVKYWNRELGLDEVRKQAENAWLNQTYDANDLYDFQVPYKNNRIFVDIETLIPLILKNPVEPVVTEAQDTPASRELAHNLHDVLLAQYQDLKIKSKLTVSLRHVLEGLRVGVLKYRWDQSIGALDPQTGRRKGGLVVEPIRPQRIVFDEGANNIDDVPLIAEYMSCTLEELVLKFPKKKVEILQAYGMKNAKDTSQVPMGQRVGYVEIWFTYYDKQGTKQEGVGWKYKHITLDKMKNPNFNYDDPTANFFDAPKKPYVLFNHLNLGRHILDDTSLTEQALPLQKVVNKRGRQIVENADQANSGLIFNGNLVNRDDVAKLIGDPSEKIVSKGPVNEAAARLPINLLPNYVISDKVDARNEIDNIFGTHAPLKGEGSNAPTLGQEMISQNQDMSRVEPIAQIVEDGMLRLYQGMVQMMKLFWDEPTEVKFTNADGKTSFMEFSSSKIEEGVAIRIRSGSGLPKDEMGKLQLTVKLAPMLDPLTLIARDFDDKDPKEIAKRIFLHNFMPERYLQEILEDDQGGTDPQALADIQSLMRGQPVPVPDAPSKEYMQTIQSFIGSGKFKALAPQIQEMIMMFAKAVVEKTKESIHLEGGQEDQATGSSSIGPAPDDRMGTGGEDEGIMMGATSGFSA